MIDHTNLAGPIASVQVDLANPDTVTAPQWAGAVYIYSEAAISAGNGSDLFPIPASAGLRLDLRGPDSPAVEQDYQLSAGLIDLLYMEG